MTDAEIEDVLCTLPSVHHRAKALTHLYQLRDRLKQALAAPPATPTPEPSDLTGPETEREIVEWLRATNAADTVRAAYGRKLAGLIEAGEYKGCRK